MDAIEKTPAPPTEELVRKIGDATACILERINPPPLALPIVRSGQALVDCGLLDNIPANVLITKEEGRSACRRDASGRSASGGTSR